MYVPSEPASKQINCTVIIFVKTYIVYMSLYSVSRFLLQAKIIIFSMIHQCFYNSREFFFFFEL